MKAKLGVGFVRRVGGYVGVQDGHARAATHMRIGRGGG